MDGRPLPARSTPHDGAAMRVLILGGTGFLGRHLAAAALERGHRVTLFNRGRTAPGLFPGAEEIHGDRRDPPERLLRGRTWDAVIDTSGTHPAMVGPMAALLADRVAHYTYVSTISVYASLHEPGVDEDAPLLPPPRVVPEQTTPETYGPLKAMCEAEVQRHVPGRALTVRPGLLVGPWDRSDRFGYWVRRISQGGRVLAPSRPDRPVQFLDARDLAAWVLRMAEARATGVFNAVGPQRPLQMEWMLESCRVEAESAAAFVWASDEFLLEQDVVPWKELPLWIADFPGRERYFLEVGNARAVAAGLTFRRILDTIRDVRLWQEEFLGTEEPESSHAISRRREEQLLRALARPAAALRG
jgi:2'-hydroxyisoflavone reductase